MKTYLEKAEEFIKCNPVAPSVKEVDVMWRNSWIRNFARSLDTEQPEKNPFDIYKPEKPQECDHSKSVGMGMCSRCGYVAQPEKPQKPQEKPQIKDLLYLASSCEICLSTQRNRGACRICALEDKIQELINRLNR